MTAQEIPLTWARAPAREIFDFKYGKALPEGDRLPGTVPVYGSNGIVGLHTTPLAAGESLVVGRKGSVGKVHHSPGACWPIDTTYFLDSFYGMPARFWFYQLRHGNLADLNRATAVPGINRDDLGRLGVVLPAIPEQVRIAKKLDNLTLRISDARRNLDRSSALLKRFRQAVLEAGVSGELTAEWRVGVDRAGDWPIVRLADVGELGRGKSKHRPRNDPRLYGGPYPFIQTGDVARSSGQITAHTQTYSELGLAQSKLWPAGTVCITIAANIADTAILTYPACFPDSVVGFVANPERCLPEFIKWQIEVISKDLKALAPATAQKNLNLELLADIEFGCPPVAEQTEIVRRVEALFTFADSLEARIEAARVQVERLTPALLAKAFRGELVPQDAAEGTGAELLARIRAGRGGEAQPKRRGRRAGGGE